MTENIVDSTSRPCDCGGTDFIQTAEGFVVCSICGLVQETAPAMEVPDTHVDPNFTRRVVQSTRVENNDYGSIINLKIDKAFLSDAKAKKLARTHYRNTVTRSNSVDIENRKILDRMIYELGIDARMADRARETLKIIQKNENMGRDSRKTQNSINVQYVGALLSVVDERVNLRENHAERIIEWITNATLDATCIETKTDKTINDVLERVKDIKCGFEEYFAIMRRIQSLETSKVEWIERVIKTARSRFYKMRYEIDGGVDFMKDEEKRVQFVLSQAGIDQYVKKILKLTDMLKGPGLVVDYLTYACATYVNAYYGKGVSFNIDSARMKKYLDYIERRCGFILRNDFDDEREIVADIIRPRIIIVDRNEFWDGVFNDDYDKVLEESLQFCEEIQRHDLDLIYSLITDRYNDVNYMMHVLRQMRREYIVDIIKLCPFMFIKDGMIEYSIYMTDLDKEIKVFLARGAAVKDVAGRAQFFIGRRRANRNSRDMYSLNVLIAKRDGSGDYLQWIPIGEVKEIVDFIYEQDGGVNPSDVVTTMIGLNFSFTTTGKKFTSSQRYKVYVTFQLLSENGFLKKSTNGFVAEKGIVETCRFIDSIEIKH